MVVRPSPGGGVLTAWFGVSAGCGSTGVAGFAAGVACAFGSASGCEGGDGSDAGQTTQGVTGEVEHDLHSRG